MRAAAALACVVFACSGDPLRAQSGTGGELAQQYQQGMAAFQGGDFIKAAADLEALVSRAEFSPQLEPIFYTIGSAYFNAGDYKKAAAAFKKYQEKFPQGPHASDAAFAVAQCDFAEQGSQRRGRAVCRLGEGPEIPRPGADGAGAGVKRKRESRPGRRRSGEGRRW